MFKNKETMNINEIDLMKWYEEGNQETAMNFLDLIWMIPLFPAAGFVINGLFGKRMPKTVVGVIACGAVLLSFIFAAGAVFQLVQLGAGAALAHREGLRMDQCRTGSHRRAASWPASQSTGDFCSIRCLVMVLVVTGIGFLIHVYSTGYMHEEDGFYRFFAYLNLFMFSMLTLILGSNYLMMFIGWEGVGLCSYLLIGYYFHKKSAGDAAKKAFVVNRIGDWGLSIGIMLIFVTFGSSNSRRSARRFAKALTAGHFHVSDPLFIGIALALFIGATGKSAQIPLFVWLPDAMEGPTPVSALIHAATMVTAGVYMVARSNLIFQMAPQAMTVVAVIGALTACLPHRSAIVQNDIKRVLAYSTVSQLGYMFLALGVGAFAAGIFHLMTHAFFKALLFLGSGSVIHAMHHEQDMRKMGALREEDSRSPSATMAIGTLAIAGTPGLAGFFSKDEILWQAFSSPHGHIAALADRRRRRGNDGVLHVPPAVHDVLRRIARGSSHRAPHSRIAEVDDNSADRAGRRFRRCRLHRIAGVAWRHRTSFEHWLEPVFEPLPIAVAAAADAMNTAMALKPEWPRFPWPSR